MQRDPADAQSHGPTVLDPRPLPAGRRRPSPRGRGTLSVRRGQGSLAAAAETMSISPPAASRLIALLEAEVRLQLFHRSRRRLQLTAQGQAFYREAEHILAGFDEIPRIAAAIRTEARGRLRLVTAPRIGRGIVSPALALFCRENPGIRASVDEQSRFGIEAQMGTRLYDLGIISLPVSHPFVEIENHPLFQVRMEAVLPAEHRLAAKPSLTAADLASEPLLGLWPGQPWRQQVDDFLRSGGAIATWVAYILGAVALLFYAIP